MHYAASGSRSLMFIDNMTDTSRVNYEVYRSIFTAQTEPTTAKLIEQHFTMQIITQNKFKKQRNWMFGSG